MSNMRNKVGPPVSGADFFPRNELMGNLCRRLRSGDNIYLVAPRRSGKTSIMFQLMERPCEGFTFVYVNTEPVDSTQVYFKKVLDEVLRSDVISDLIQHKSKLRNLFNNVLDRVKKLGPVELHERPEEKYSDVFMDLMTRIDPDELQLVIMVDEFPSTVANIAKREGEEAAISFLQLNRNLRQHPSRKIQMIYTGSIGLSALVSKLKVSSSVNDLRNFEIPPFTNAEATELCRRLFKHQDIAYTSELIEEILSRIGWLMPFFVQLAVSQLIDLYYAQKKQPLTKEDVSKAIEKSSSLGNSNHFESYYQRINTSFTANDAEFAHDLLRRIASDGSYLTEDVTKLESASDDDRIRFVLNSLELDGYITNIEGKLRFHSPILREWWKRYSY